MPTQTPETIVAFLQSFDLNAVENGQASLSSGTTIIDVAEVAGHSVPRYTNEYWTAKQRQASNIQEISYRACFKPQLPGFFIRHLTNPGDTIYDPFSGRGTTPLEAGLLGRKVIANDINPLSKILTEPRFFVPNIEDVRERLLSIPGDPSAHADRDLSMFYHPSTESEIVSLRQYLLSRVAEGTVDHLDQWIRMVATNRLTGHSPGFFSVYTLPPNQAVSPGRQIKINKTRSQTPPYRSVHNIILKKSKSLIKGVTEQEICHLQEAGRTARFFTSDARQTSEIPDNSVMLTVTSPPFLDIVQYSGDNWLRCWFNGIDSDEVAKKISHHRRLDDWASVMGDVFLELYRITCMGGFVAFEVGELRKGSIRLDETVVPLGCSAGFDCMGIIINSQNFTKTANIWGVSNMEGGTNTNRIVLFRKD
ncbi:MAG TPA: DNA methyltransferase [Methanospirillum sp.]|nr:DNA methyltransferase [Methanospirillum sp.]